MGLSSTNDLASLAGIEGGFAPLDSGLLVPRAYLPGVRSARARITAGDYTLNNTAWTAVDATNLSLTIAAATGDVVLVSLSSLWGTQAVAGCLDVATIVSASPVNYISGGGGASDLGIGAWFGDSATASSTLNIPVGGAIQYVVQAGDISGGNVVFRLMYRTTTAANKGLGATTALSPLQFSVMNLGQ